MLENESFHIVRISLELSTTQPNAFGTATATARETASKTEEKRSQGRNTEAGITRANQSSIIER